jgi:RNA-splicing ligase RtcB
MVGVDIGCGVETIGIVNKRLELPRLDNAIYKNIPSGV